MPRSDKFDRGPVNGIHNRQILFSRDSKYVFHALFLQTFHQ